MLEVAKDNETPYCHKGKLSIHWLGAVLRKVFKAPL